MHADAASFAGDADAQQVETLCDELGERIEAVQAEQVLLGQLVATAEQKRLYRSRQYRVLLVQAQEQYRRLRELIVRYCR